MTFQNSQLEHVSNIESGKGNVESIKVATANNSINVQSTSIVKDDNQVPDTNIRSASEITNPNFENSY